MNVTIKSKVARGKDISETKPKQPSPCSNCMHRPVMSWPLFHHGLFTWLLHALTAWDLKFQVCLGYTFTPATLNKINVLPQPAAPMTVYNFFETEVK